MNYETYSIQLRCGHTITRGDFQQIPHEGECAYCTKCRSFYDIVKVYRHEREIDDVEEMME